MNNTLRKSSFLVRYSIFCTIPCSIFHILIFLLFFSSCDKITTPLKNVQGNSALPTTPPTFRDSSININKLKVLLEDCTGHLCINCPLAAADAETLLQGAYGSQIVM